MTNCDIRDKETLRPRNSRAKKRASLAIAGSGYTDVGFRRTLNQDAFLALDELGLYVVSDGVGGNVGGEVAAITAVRVASEVVAGRRDVLKAVAAGELEPDALVTVAHDATWAANRAVYERAQDDPTLRGMGCTFTMLLVAGRQAALAHAGDSRAYRNRHGRTAQLTIDHTYAQDLYRLAMLSEEELKNHPRAHVLTRCVGIRPWLPIDVRLLDVQEGDRFVLCSDGFSGYVPGPTWLAQELSSGDRHELGQQFIQHALDCGGSDNVTVVIADVKDAPETEEAPNDQRMSGVRRRVSLRDDEVAA